MGYTSVGLTDGGRTAHYQISYDDSYPSAQGQGLAQGLVDACEQDFDLMQSWFAGVGLKFALPIPVHIANASGGARWSSDGQVPPQAVVTISPVPLTSVDTIRYLLVSEVTEMFMASQNKGWFERGIVDNDEGSAGEGLSRFLGVQFQVANLGPALPPLGFAVVPTWLNSSRSDYVDDNPDDIKPDQVTGCTTCFIFYLHDQLGYGIPAIIAAADASLARVYTNLTGRSDAWAAFSTLVNTYYPPGRQYQPVGESIFPVANLHTLFDFLTGTIEVVSGGQAVSGVGLDKEAKAEVTIQLTSDDPSVLTVPSQVTVQPGAQNATLQLRSAPITGPQRLVTVRASYAGSTLTGGVVILPRPSTLEGSVTDSSGSPLSDILVRAATDQVVDPSTGRDYVEVATDTAGVYRTGVVPHGAYAVSALGAGFVPGRANVTITEGQPVTIQDFTLDRSLPFGVAGTVTDAEAAAPISGAAVMVWETVTPEIATGGGNASTTTDAAGEYSVTVNPDPYDGDYRIAAAAAGYTSNGATTRIPNGAAIIQDLRLVRPSAVITGTVTDAGDGTPLGGVTVTAKSTADVLVGQPPTAFSESASTDARGTYTLSGVPAGQITVAAIVEAVIRRRPVIVGSGEQTVTVDNHQTLTLDFPLVLDLEPDPNPKPGGQRPQ